MFSLVAVGVSALIATAGGCASTQSRSADAGQGVATLEAPQAQRQYSSVAPPEADRLPYKQAVKREAMRGLVYEDDRVRLDPVEAPKVARPGTREEAMALYTEAHRLLEEENRVLDAIKGFTRAVITKPDEAILYTGLGWALLAEKKDRKGLAAYRTAVELDPNLVEGWRGLGDASRRVADTPGAIAAWRRTIELDPADARTHWRLAVQEYYSGNSARAWDLAMEAERLGEPAPPQFVNHLRDELNKQADKIANDREGQR